MKMNQTIKLKNIKPNNWNPNEMTKEEFAELVAEIKHLKKPAKPIVLRKLATHYEIVDGEHTYKALKENKFKELQPDWYEIIDVDDSEAIRQTYKRNQHGKHNPVKQGLMFKRVLAETGMSNRELAKKWELSEGTVRNSLLYAEIAEMRNDYADISRLTIRQSRIYLLIAKYSKTIADYWLACGGLEESLPFWFTKSNVFKPLFTLIEETIFGAEYGNPCFELSDFKDFDRYSDYLEFENKITFPQDQEQHRTKDYWINKFKEKLRTISDALRLESLLLKNTSISDIKLLKEYVKIYLFGKYGHYGKHQGYKYLIEEIFNMISVKEVGRSNALVKEDKLIFLLKPNEIIEVLNSNESKTTEHIINQVKIKISEKHGVKPSEIRQDTFGQTLRERLYELELKDAPSFIKKSRIPQILKWLFYTNTKGDKKFKNVFKQLESSYLVNNFKKINLFNEEETRDALTRELEKINKDLEFENQKSKLIKRTEEEIATSILENLKSAFKKEPSKTEIERISKRLIACFGKGWLLLFENLATRFYNEQEWAKSQNKKLLEELAPLYKEMKKRSDFLYSELTKEGIIQKQNKRKAKSL